MRPESASPTPSLPSVLRWARKRLLIPAGLAAAVGVATVAPLFDPPAVSAEGITPVRSLTPGKRRDEVVGVYEQVKAAVVNIHSERTVVAPSDDPFDRSPVRPQQVNGMGTGVVLDPTGYVLTNFHVIDDVQSLRVRLHDGTGYPARVVATDKAEDLAVIKIDPVAPLPVIRFGTSSDLMVGEPVIAIGNAFGYEHSVTQGRVSYIGRDVTLNKEVSYRGLIQVDTPINPGNSGGPLLNVYGELVGLNVAIRAGAQNIAFALQADLVIPKAAEMIARRRAGLRHGLVVRDRASRPTVEAPAEREVTVALVEPGSPAATAGFQTGDVIDRVGDIPVYTSIDLERGLLGKGAGETVPVKVTRDGMTAVALELPLAPVMKAAATPTDVVWSRLGIKVRAVGAETVAAANPKLRGGLLVTDVAVGGTAASAGIGEGDILVGLHQWETLRPDDVAFVLNHKEYTSFLPLKCFAVRDGKLKEKWITGNP